MIYTSKNTTKHEKSPKVGILLANLGTPEAPTPTALRKYLKQFLGDGRVVEANRLLWWFILNFIILTFRPKKSAHAYQTVWGEKGSPLMVYSKLQAEKLQQQLSDHVETPVHVELAMTYGSPSIEEAMNRLRQNSCTKMFVLPLYPQYSGSTVAAVTDQVFDVLKSWRRVPDLRVLSAYYDEPTYIEALASSVREQWEKYGQAEKLMMSFHGIPKRYLNNGDPYPCHCRKTARLLAENLGLNEDQWMITFQSIFGREEWIKPYTADQLKTWGKEGVKSVDVICPGFAADCLETLEEIKVENKGYFVEAGGDTLNYIPALNDRDDHIAVLEGLVHRECTGWLKVKSH
ncbi:MAG: ferrochelatase [Ghiorsea sp.]